MVNNLDLTSAVKNLELAHDLTAADLNEAEARRVETLENDQLSSSNAYTQIVSVTTRFYDYPMMNFKYSVIFVDKTYA